MFNVRRLPVPVVRRHAHCVTLPERNDLWAITPSDASPLGEPSPIVRPLPLYTTDEGGSVLISSDTWPNVGGVLGLTRAQIAEARGQCVQPPGGGGFAYMAGPDNALVEYAGDYPAERFNQVHL